MSKLPEPDNINDRDAIVVAGPNNTSLTYIYDKQSRLFHREDCGSSDGCRHGDTHASGIDPIPLATCVSDGLMSARDKCLLESKIGTRLGVLGFSGSGIPDDGGYLGGDITLSSKSSFLRIERFGNVITFNVDVPIPLSCGSCDECSELFMVQDESDVNSIRPPVCAGKLPGLNVYNDFTVNLVGNRNATNPGNVLDILAQKSSSPAFLFKRLGSGDAFLEVILKRNNANQQASVGFKVAPNTTTGMADCVLHMGNDQANTQIKVDITPNNIPKALGSMRYNGTTITKQPAIVVDYTNNILSDNKYQVRRLDLQTNSPIGDSFTAQNMWTIENPLNGPQGQNPRRIVLDYTNGLLEIGTVVDIITVDIGLGVQLHFFSKKPDLDTKSMWVKTSEVSFGPFLTSRNASNGTEGPGTTLITGVQKNVEKSLWGVSGVLPFRIVGGTDGDVPSDIIYDTELPGLTYNDEAVDGTHFVWSRLAVDDALLRYKVGRPNGNSGTKNIDIPIRSAFDALDTFIGIITDIIEESGTPVVEVRPLHNTPPQFGVFRTVSGSEFAYESVYLDINNPTNINFVGISSDHSLVVGDIITSMPDQYDQTVLRFEFNLIGGSSELTVKLGEYNSTSDTFESGLQSSGRYTQNAGFTGVGTKPSTNSAGFVVYNGGSQIGGIEDEYWNDVEIMLRDDQVWVWWNKLLIVPTTGSGKPYFETSKKTGKNGIKMTKGTSLRSIEIATPIRVFNEFEYGNLQIV